MGIKYSYANDEHGSLTYIDDAIPGTTYHCPQCGNEMIPKLGTITTHHYAHKVECSCNGESYLHYISKMVFKDIFDKSSEFFLEYCTPVTCPYQYDRDCCIFEDKDCNTFDKKIKKLNLKSIYDQCLIEASVNDGQFYADILLKDTTGKVQKDLLIEFYHTHKCEHDKIYSGYPIVEIKVENEDDIINTNHIPFNDKISLYGFKSLPCDGKKLYYASFEDEYEADDVNVSKRNCLDIFMISYDDYYQCSSAFAIAIDPLSYLEFSMHHRFKQPPSIGEVVCAIAYTRGFTNFENCDVCGHSRRSKYNIEKIWCTESKHNPDIPKEIVHRAISCPKSWPNKNRIIDISKYISNLKYEILRCVK